MAIPSAIQIFDTVRFTHDAEGRSPAPFRAVPVTAGTLGRVVIVRPEGQLKVVVLAGDSGVPLCFVETSSDDVEWVASGLVTETSASGPGND